MTLLEWAQYYVYELGFSVIPLKYRGKTPLTAWKKYQTRKPGEKELRTWFHRQDRNTGIITGEVSGGLCVIDFDDKDVFFEWASEIGGDLPMVSTGKGFHVYFQCLADHASTGKAYFRGRHLGEIRYNGGYVVAPPSIHPSGHQYRWIGTVKLQVVDFRSLGIKTKVEKSKKSGASYRQVYDASGIPSNVRDPWKYCQAALKREVLKILSSQPGIDRNDTLFRAGLKMKKYLGVLEEDTIRRELFEAGMAVGLPEKEVKRTLDSAWKY